MPRIAVCYLVDADGRVLLQHRDEHAPRAADQWGMVGGHVEDGEDPDDAVHRELAEETGLSAADLELWHAGPFTYSDGHRSDYRIYAARTDAVDDDVVLGEGRAIVFVEPERARTLDLAESNAHFLPLFLASPTYRRLTSTPGSTDS